MLSCDLISSLVGRTQIESSHFAGKEIEFLLAMGFVFLGVSAYECYCRLRRVKHKRDQRKLYILRLKADIGVRQRKPLEYLSGI